MNYNVEIDNNGIFQIIYSSKGHNSHSSILSEMNVNLNECKIDILKNLYNKYKYNFIKNA